MSRPAFVPDEALHFFFAADNGKSGDYFLWNRFVRRGLYKEQTWYWYALGRDGEEESAPEATAAARAWIRNGVASEKRPQQ